MSLIGLPWVVSEVIFELFMILNHEKLWQTTIILETLLLWDLESLHFTQIMRLLLREEDRVVEHLIIILFSIESRVVVTLGIVILLLLANFWAEDYAFNVHLYIIIFISTCT